MEGEDIETAALVTSPCGMFVTFLPLPEWTHWTACSATCGFGFRLGDMGPAQLNVMGVKESSVDFQETSIFRKVCCSRVCEHSGTRFFLGGPGGTKTLTISPPDIFRPGPDTGVMPCRLHHAAKQLQACRDGDGCHQYVCILITMLYISIIIKQLHIIYSVISCSRMYVYIRPMHLHTIYIYLYIHVYVHVHSKYIYIYLFIYLCIYLFTYLYIYTSMYIYIYIMI